MSSTSSSRSSPNRSSRLPTSAPSSPPEITMEDEEPIQPSTEEEKALFIEEQKAQIANDRAEERRRKLALKRRKQVQESDADRKNKAKQLDELLTKSAAFSDILTKKTEVLGKVGSGFDGKALGEHNLEMAKQPKCMIGGTMRDYQLEGLTWMYEICSQGMSGILADEMGLGKTIQTISIVGKLREENCYGPHLIVAPMSTLSNWREEFQKWVPGIPVAFYHGAPGDRKMVFRDMLMRNYKGGQAGNKFPVVLTTPEIIMRDAADLSKIKWDFVYIDEGHRLKNFDSKLFRTLRSHFTSTTRFLITGTPLQNNLKELWSLLNFLLPNIFTFWEQFESWFDFSELEDEEKTEEFIEDKAKQDLIKKMHLILQPLLLRRIKADVEHLLPKKREYILYAPMTKEQTDLYNAINDASIDTRQFLENKVFEHLTGTTNTPAISRRASPTSTNTKTEDSDSEDEIPLSKLALQRGQPALSKSETPKNAFQQMMQRKKPTPTSKSTPSKKRKAESIPAPAPKSAKSSRNSTPSVSSRGRKVRKSKGYEETYPSDEDALSDDEFEQMIATELAQKDEVVEPEGSKEEIQRAKTLELAKKEIARKKLGNPLMQLRLVCNSPHNFYDPWSLADTEVDSTLITASGKFLLLDRLLPYLFQKGHKVLIFSQFATTLNLLSLYCSLKSIETCRIDGSIPQIERQEAIRRFNTEPDLKLFLLSTRAGGQGINLAVADTVILFDSDFNPQMDLQAMDRAHRIGQKNPVIVFRFATKGTVEEDLLLNADAKRRLEKLVIKKGGFRTLGQKVEGGGGGGGGEEINKDVLKALLLKEGMVWKWREGEGVLSEGDLKVLCDRSPEAYERADGGDGGGEGWMVVKPGERGGGGLVLEGVGKKGKR